MRKGKVSLGEEVGGGGRGERVCCSAAENKPL